MKKEILFWLSIGLMVLIASCEKSITYNGKELQSVLVLNARISAGDSITCHLTSSKPITSVKGLMDIDDAKIEILKDGVSIGFLEGKGNGIYTSSQLVEEGGSYALSASKSGYNSITSNCEVPNKPQATLKSIEAQQVYDADQGVYVIPKLKLNLEIADSEKEEFYRVRVFQRYLADQFYYSDPKDVVIDTLSFIWGEAYYETKDPLLSREIDDFSDEPENSYQIFPDYTFAGEKYEIPIEVDLGRGRFEPWVADSIPLFYRIEVQSLTKELFLYYKSLEAQDWYGDSPFSEPVQLYSNIKNGYGIFGATSKNIVNMRADLIQVLGTK